MQLQKDSQQIQEAGLQIVGISYDSAAILSDFAQKRSISYRLLSDPESKTIDAYEVRNKQARGRQAGIPHPTTFVVDKQGVIRAKLPGEVRVRHTTAQLLEAAKSLAREP